MKNLAIKFLSLIIAVSIVSCDEEEFLKEQPKASIFSDNLFNNHTGFESGMNAVYALMRDMYTDGDTRTRDQLWVRSEEHTSELQSRENLVCRLLLEKKKKRKKTDKKQK